MWAFLYIVMRGLSCSAACGIFSDQGLIVYLLHWQADSLPLSLRKDPPPPPRPTVVLIPVIWGLCHQTRSWDEISFSRTIGEKGSMK